MLFVDHAKVAAAAEALRLGRFTRRQGMRVGLGAGALLFAIAALGMLICVAYEALNLVMSPWASALIVFAVVGAAVAVLVTLAVRSVPGPIECEAVIIRRQALVELEPTLTRISSVSKGASLALSARKALRKAKKTDRLTGVADLASRFVRRR